MCGADAGHRHTDPADVYLFHVIAVWIAFRGLALPSLALQLVTTFVLLTPLWIAGYHAIEGAVYQGGREHREASEPAGGDQAAAVFDAFRAGVIAPISETITMTSRAGRSVSAASLTSAVVPRVRCP